MVLDYTQVIQPQKLLPSLIRLAEDHFEVQKVAVLQVAVSRQGVDGECLEGVVEEQAQTSRLRRHGYDPNPSFPTRFKEAHRFPFQSNCGPPRILEIIYL